MCNDATATSLNNAKFTELETCLKTLRTAYFRDPYPEYRARLMDLNNLERLIRDNTEALVQAISQDYGHRSEHETMLLEILPILQGITYSRRHLKKWMRPQQRHVDQKAFFGGQNTVFPQPLGIVGVIVPWNFPLFLAFSPLTMILAAGNRAMVKMSENSRHLAALLMKLIPNYFGAEKIRIFDEIGGVGIEFSKQKFDHLIFTGSGQTGRAVMSAAAANLCPVTLELGGKSPALLADDFHTRTAVERIMNIKCLNAGQICTTVDYVMVSKKRVNEFVELAHEVVSKRYASLGSADLSSIIDHRAYKRLRSALQDAQDKGATLLPLISGAAFDDTNKRIAPHIVLNAPPNCNLMTNEIFGPILPVLVYDSIEEAIAFINGRDRPLAFYPFSNDKKLIDKLLKETLSGGVTINDALYHVAQHDMPFGGVGASGMGHYHGQEGFNTFSKLRAIFKQAKRTPLKYMTPPYGQFFNKVIKFLTKIA